MPGRREPQIQGHLLDLDAGQQQAAAGVFASATIAKLSQRFPQVLYGQAVQMHHAQSCRLRQLGQGDRLVVGMALDEVQGQRQPGVGAARRGGGEPHRGQGLDQHAKKSHENLLNPEIRLDRHLPHVDAVSVACHQRPDQLIQRHRPLFHLRVVARFQNQRLGQIKQRFAGGPVREKIHRQQFDVVAEPLQARDRSWYEPLSGVRRGRNFSVHDFGPAAANQPRGHSRRQIAEIQLIGPAPITGNQRRS
ncbi:MAG TPA: hypothetical protein DCX07_07580 [Phycisphaerales bacterium]|nr:hypothetical protein [Phycisphaerales bacterium]